jgi:XRE family transcriptional regulator, regulator of sulfur utilization
VDDSVKGDLGVRRDPAIRVIGAAIRRLREQRGWTLERLAGAAGISYQYLSGIETGKENFSIRILEQVAAALGVPLVAVIAEAYGIDVGPGRAAA